MSSSDLEPILEAGARVYAARRELALAEAELRKLMVPAAPTSAPDITTGTTRWPPAPPPLPMTPGVLYALPDRWMPMNSDSWYAPWNGATITRVADGCYEWRFDKRKKNGICPTLDTAKKAVEACL